MLTSRRATQLKLAIAIAIAAASASMPTAVHAATITGGEEIVVAAADGATELTITGTGGTYQINDEAVPPVPGAGCVATADPDTVTCTSTGRRLAQAGSTGPDTVDARQSDIRMNWVATGPEVLRLWCGMRYCSVTGGDGADRIVGGIAGDNLVGGAGNDILIGGAGHDGLFGSAGDDQLSGGPGSDFSWCGEDAEGADVYRGGAGFDRYDCGGSDSPVTIRLDNLPNDGIAGEGDNIGADVELVAGSEYDDVLVGSAASNRLYGDVGDDRISGGRGRDYIYGAVGDDRLFGDAGNDDLSGGDGADLLSGGQGFDRTSYGGDVFALLFADARSGRGVSDTDFPRIEGVRVTIDGQANDGEPGERDNVIVEGVTGTQFDDVLIGSGASNELLGLDGNDRLYGRGGADELRGGDDVDILVGGTGRDELIGEEGNDLLQARDGVADTISCGMGIDRVIADRLDPAWATCERFFRP